MKKSKSVMSWLLPTFLILFICEVLTLPLILVLTYAGNSAAPVHTFELKNKKLTWDSDTDVRDDGTAELSLFSAYYDSVNSDNGDHVVAPGTAADVLLKFINKSGGTVTYYAYMYEVKSDSDLPVTTNMSSKDAAEVNSYPVPEALSDKNIITALKGSATKDTVAEFTIAWNWIFEVDDEHDVKDTYFGDKAAFDKADDITVGFYFVVQGDEDEGGDTPLSPKTGDNTIPYALAIIAVSGVILIILFYVERRRKRRGEY